MRVRAYSHVFTQTHTTNTCKHARTHVFARARMVCACVGACVCACGPPACVRGCECVSVRVSLNLSVCACALGRARAPGACAGVRQRPCGCVAFMCVFACVLVRAFVRMRRSACARVRLCLRAFVCVCECVLPFHRQSISAHVCVRGCAWVCAWHDSACMPRRCVVAVVARRRPAVLIARPAAARASLRWVRSAGRRARRPQVEPSPIVQRARHGLRDMGTRPWSTPPAPSTSSAASSPASPPPSPTTCG